MNGKLKNILALTWALVCTFGVPDGFDKIISAMFPEIKVPSKSTSSSHQTTATTITTDTSNIRGSVSTTNSTITTTTPVLTQPIKPIENKPATQYVPPIEPKADKPEDLAKPVYTPPAPVAAVSPKAKVTEEPAADEEDPDDEIEASSQNYPGERFRVASAETIGVRRTMEDFIRVVRNYRGKSDEDLFCVFDGHGSRRPAEYSGETLPKTLESFLEMYGEDTQKAMESTFLDVDKRMADWAKESGTTACVGLVQGTKLTVANVGDTRAVLCRGGKAIRLSFDHKPKVPSEKERIEKLGGFVAMGRVNAVLAVSRALGDSQVDNLVTAEPYVSVTQLLPEDEFLIIACDGVWDILEDQNAVDVIRNMENNKDAVLAAEELRNNAFNGGSNDNISVVVIFLKS